MKASKSPNNIINPLSFLRQKNLNHILLLVVFSLLLLTIIPFYHQSFLQTFQWILSSSSKSVSANKTENRKDEGKSRCDLFVGEWVPDHDAPYYYTNSTCSLIRENRDCLGNGRPNKDYLRWKWRPDGCDLPRFDAGGFLDMVRGKVMAFVGDSLARNQMESLVCLLSTVEYPKDISNSTNDDFKLMFYEKHNFTIVVFWSHALVRTTPPPNKDLNGLWTLYLDEVDQTWFSHISYLDYIVMSDGNWFMKRSMYYEKGKLVGCYNCGMKGVRDLTMQYGNRRAFRTAFAAIKGLDDYKGTVFLRTLSPDHFENGEWDSGGNCLKTKPYGRDHMTMSEVAAGLYLAQVEEFREAERGKAEGGLDFRLLDVTRAMLQRPDGHPSGYGHRRNQTGSFRRNDCVHWCLPGPVEVWNEFLYQMMRV